MDSHRRIGRYRGLNPALNRWVFLRLASESKKPIAMMGFCYINHMEREKRFELSTYTLARYRSTN